MKKQFLVPVTSVLLLAVFAIAALLWALIN